MPCRKTKTKAQTKAKTAVAIARSADPEYSPALLAALNNLWRQAKHCREKGEAVPVLVVVIDPGGNLTIESHYTPGGGADDLRWRHLMSLALGEAAEHLRPKPEDLVAPERVM